MFIVTMNKEPIYVTTTREEAEEWKEHEIRHRITEEVPDLRILALEPTWPDEPTCWFVPE